MERSAFGRSGVPMVSCHLQNAWSLSLSLADGFFFGMYSGITLFCCFSLHVVVAATTNKFVCFYNC